MSDPIPPRTQARPRLPTVPVGWPLWPLPDADGRLAWPDPALSVRQRIEAILRTAPGEQLLHPEFGAGLDRLIHQPNTLETRARAKADVAAALARYEPRIRVDQVEVTAGADPRELLVTVAYTLALTGALARIAVAAPVGGG